MSKKIKKKKENYLDHVFSHAAAVEWDCDEKGNVTLIIENKGFFKGLFPSRIYYTFFEPQFPVKFLMKCTF